MYIHLHSEKKTLHLHGCAGDFSDARGHRRVLELLSDFSFHRCWSSYSASRLQSLCTKRLDLVSVSRVSDARGSKKPALCKSSDLMQCSVQRIEDFELY